MDEAKELLKKRRKADEQPMSKEEFDAARADVIARPGFYAERLQEEAKEKLKSVSASAVAAAIGVGSSSRFDQFLRTAFWIRRPPTEWTKSLQHFGNVQEYSGVAYVEDAVDRLFYSTGDHQQYYRKGRWTCFPDGEDDEVIIEVKSRAPELPPYTSKDKNWREHMPQVQQNLYLTDKTRCLLACYISEPTREQCGFKSRIWEVYPTEKYLAKMHAMLEEFHDFIDGKKHCPVRISRKPKMPDVEFRLIDGPIEVEEVTQEKITPKLVESIAATKAKSCWTIEALDALEEQLNLEHPGHAKRIIEGTRSQREFLNDPDQGF